MLTRETEGRKDSRLYNLVKQINIDISTLDFLFVLKISTG